MKIYNTFPEVLNFIKRILNRFELVSAIIFKFLKRRFFFDFTRFHSILANLILIECIKPRSLQICAG